MPTYANPNTPIRTALVDGLRVAVSGNTWAGILPKDRGVLENYILITSQTKNSTERSKCGFEWLCTVNFDIYHLNLLGYNSCVEVDEVEAKIISFIENGFTVVGFDLKSHELVNSVDLNLDTDTNSIERRVLTYQFWVMQKNL